MNFRKVIYFSIIFLSALVIIASLLSLLHNLPYWYSKVLDFPRLQYLIVGTILLVIFILLTKHWGKSSYWLVAGLVVAIVIQSVKIFPYWFGNKTVPDAVATVSEENTVSVLLTNVLIENRDAAKFLEVIEAADPDIIIVMEVSQWWLGELEGLKKEYPFFEEQPNEDAYGIALYSRLPLKETELKYIKHKNVPSFHSIVQLRSGKEFKLHAVHPVAPMPSDEYPDNVGEAEIELVRVGKFVAEEKLPSMVAGDFNDVSWSNTTRLFEENGELNNVRIGRGLYNTFDAKSMFMRWPLDHFFVTKEFAVVEMKRLDKIGSDHFPIIAKFTLRD